MTSVVDRRAVVALAAVSVFVFALVLVARSQAGSQGATFSTFVAPGHVTTGATALAGAKFTPTGLSNNGSATHATITLTFLAGTQGIAVTACPGTSTIVGNVATCFAGSVQNGQTAKMFATFTAGAASATAQSVAGHVTWDVPGGGSTTGGSNFRDSSSDYTVFATNGATDGACSTSTSFSLSASDNNGTGKGASFDGGTVAGTFGFPCTPAQVDIDSALVPGASTPGSWSLIVAPLANGALAQATLTIASLPSGITWKKAQLFEVFADAPTLRLVPSCGTGGAMPTGADVCQSSPQVKFGQGVKFFLNVLGTGIDPRVTS